VAGAVHKTSGPVSRFIAGGEPPATPRTKRAARFPGPLVWLQRAVELGQVVADVAEDVLDLAAKEDHRDDDGDGDPDADDADLEAENEIPVEVEEDESSMLDVVLDTIVP